MFYWYTNSPSNSRSRVIKKLTGYTKSATRPAQLIFVVIPRMKPKLNDFNKMLEAESADDTKQGVWPARFKDWTAVSRTEQTKPQKSQLSLRTKRGVKIDFRILLIRAWQAYQKTGRQVDFMLTYGETKFSNEHWHANSKSRPKNSHHVTVLPCVVTEHGAKTVVFSCCWIFVCSIYVKHDEKMWCFKYE